ncbi:DUF7560 family zinc ribbon protein [Halobaculum sp. D14]
MHRREQTFVCPDCATSIAVDAEIRAALVEHGCAVCGGAVPKTAFTSA